MHTVLHPGTKAFLAVALAHTATLLILDFPARAQRDDNTVAPRGVHHPVVSEAAWVGTSVSPVGSRAYEDTEGSGRVGGMPAYMLRG